MLQLSIFKSPVPQELLTMVEGIKLLLTPCSNKPFPPSSISSHLLPTLDVISSKDFLIFSLNCKYTSDLWAHKISPKLCPNF